jgi:hypothetical protein
MELWDGAKLRGGPRARLEWEWARMALLTAPMRKLEGERAEAIRTDRAPAVELLRHLLRLRGIGVNSAWVYVMEFFDWRQFQNRRQVGGLVGLTPSRSSGSIRGWRAELGAGDRQGPEPLHPGHGHGDCLGVPAVSAAEGVESVVPRALRPGRIFPQFGR